MIAPKFFSNIELIQLNVMEVLHSSDQSQCLKLFPESEVVYRQTVSDKCRKFSENR